MRKKYLIIAATALATLVLASCVPAMVSSLPEAQSQSLAKSNQTSFISEYQPVCPEESYNKITELYEGGLSEEEIAEELAFPVDIVTEFLKGNYTPPPYPESNQSISPSDCPTYSKIKDLYGEGWSEEEIAETLELPLDIVHGFLSGDYAIIALCPEPYQKSVTAEKPMESITPEKSMEQWRKEHTVKVKAIRTLKYEQGYLETKEIYMSEEFKKRFGRDNFTKELRIPVSASDSEMIGIREGEERTSVTEEERMFTTASDYFT